MKRLLGLLLAIAMLLSLVTVPALAEGEAAAAPEAEETPFNGIHVDFATATDEELAAAITAIKAEQRTRIVTKIELDATEISVKKGGSVKVTATMVDLPEGVKAGQFKWDTSDKAIATVSNGSVRGVAPGEAVITCTNVLSDGTEITNECRVTVFVPVTGVSVKTKSIDLGADEELQTAFEVKPADATNAKLAYTSSDESVVTVDGNGLLFGAGIGSATVTATSTDGTEKSASITVKVTKKDDMGVTKTDEDKGISVTLVGIRSSKGSSWFKPAGENIFVFPKFEITNNSDDSISVSTSDFSKYCDGIYVDYSFDAACSEKNGLDGTIYPGKKLKGEVGLEVPKDWKELKLKISFGWFAEDLTFVIYNND